MAMNQSGLKKSFVKFGALCSLGASIAALPAMTTSAEAAPLLVQEVLQVQSANIQGVSGASYTSQGFYTSLVSALSKAGISV